MSLKVGFKIGDVQLDFEGPADTFAVSFEPILRDLIEYGKERGASPSQSTLSGQKKDPVDPLARKSSAIPAMTVKSIAAKLNVDSGPSLVSAAMASLTIVGNQQTCTRQQIIDEMKEATGYFKPTYRGNLSSSLDGLVKKDVLIEVSKDTYALKETARVDLEQRLAQ